MPNKMREQLAGSRSDVKDVFAALNRERATFEKAGRERLVEAHNAAGTQKLPGDTRIMLAHVFLVLLVRFAVVTTVFYALGDQFLNHGQSFRRIVWMRLSKRRSVVPTWQRLMRRRESRKTTPQF
jgi:hypothetical protein